MDLDDEELKATRESNGADRIREEIKVSPKIQEAINKVSEMYKQQGRKLEEEDKLVIYLNELDQYIVKKLKIKQVYRYMDDIIILVKTKSEAKKALNDIEKFLKEKLELELKEVEQKYKLEIRKK